MCGRFTIKSGLEDFLEAFPFLDARLDDPEVLAPRYNVAPTQPVPVVRGSTRGPGGGVRSGHRLGIEAMRWGFIPFFADDPAVGSRMINARSETAAEKPAFRDAFRHRRCLVLADGFYEWKKSPDGRTKTPMYIRLLGGRPFAFAGLWDSWRAPGAEPILSCTILTTEPNDLVREVHDRMPVLFADPEEAERWLDPRASREQLGALLRAVPACRMEAWPVSKVVNDPKNETPACVERAAPTTLFGD